MHMHKSDLDTQPHSDPVASIKLICHNLLQAGTTLHVNDEARILSLLYEQPPAILTQQQFTRNEWMLLMALLQNYPYYAPHEELLSSITCLTVDECRKRVQETRILGADVLKRELKPVYRALCGIRSKLAKLHPHLRVSLVRDAGYLLTVSL